MRAAEDSGITLSSSEEQEFARLARQLPAGRYRVRPGALTPGEVNGIFGAILADSDDGPRRFESVGTLPEIFRRGVLRHKQGKLPTRANETSIGFVRGYLHGYIFAPKGSPRRILVEDNSATAQRATQRVPKRRAQRQRKRVGARNEQRCFLVLWRWEEALDQDGVEPSSSVGDHMRGVAPGDRLYVCAVHDNDLFALGMLEVTRSRTTRDLDTRRRYFRFEAVGRSAFGPFRLLPMGPTKWQLTFAHTKSRRLSRRGNIAFQVRARRQLTAESAALLDNVLGKALDTQRQLVNAFRKEARRMERSVSVLERDPRNRRAALRLYGLSCAICHMDMGEAYGNFAKECVEVHHLKPLAKAKQPRVPDSKDFRVLCPNCHRVLHRTEDPSDWRRLRRDVQRIGRLNA